MSFKIDIAAELMQLSPAFHYIGNGPSSKFKQPIRLSLLLDESDISSAIQEMMQRRERLSRLYLNQPPLTEQTLDFGVFGNTYPKSNYWAKGTILLRLK